MAAHATRMQTVRTMMDRTVVPAKMVLLEMEPFALVHCVLHTSCMCLVHYSDSVCLFIYLFVSLFKCLVSRLVDGRAGWWFMCLTLRSSLSTITVLNHSFLSSS